MTISRLSAESRRIRRATPCCRRRRMTVCVQVWILQTLSAVVSRFRGQNTLLLCLHVRRSGLCCQPDPPVLPTGSVVRSLRYCQRDHLPLHGSLPQTIPFGRLSYQKDWEIRNLSSALRTGDRSKGDLLCSNGNPASGLLPLLIHPFVGAGCSAYAQFSRATPVLAHVWRRVTVTLLSTAT